MLGSLYNTLLFQPLLNLLVLLYNYLWNDIGIAIIILTIVIRLILYPSFKHQLESQQKLAALQPKLKEIKEKHKDNPQEQSKALMEFYRLNKINPLGSCLPLIVQLVILLALFRVFQVGLNGAVGEHLYAFVANPGKISPLFLGFLDMTRPNIILALITGALQYWQSRQLSAMQTAPKDPSDMASAMSRQMVYILPVITVIFGAQLPAGLTIYWLVTTAFAILQQFLIIGTRREKLNQTA